MGQHPQIEELQRRCTELERFAQQLFDCVRLLTSHDQAVSVSLTALANKLSVDGVVDGQALAKLVAGVFDRSSEPDPERDGLVQSIFTDAAPARPPTLPRLTLIQGGKPEHQA